MSSTASSPTPVPQGYVPHSEMNSFMDHIGPFYRKETQDGVALLLDPLPKHLNPGGLVHGGVLMAMMDVTLGATGMRLHPHADFLATMHLSVNMLSSAKRGERLMSEATLDRSTRTASFLNGRIFADGKLVMTAIAVFRNPPEATTANQRTSP